MFKILFYLAIVPSILLGENSPRLLKPKKIVEKPRTLASTEVYSNYGISILATTPLLGENFYDKRFTTYGPTFLFDWRLHHFNEEHSIGVETGLSLPLSILTTTQPLTSFLHMYFMIPLHARYVWQINESFSFDAFLGGQFCFLSLSTRASVDGGFQFHNELGIVQLSAGIGGMYALSENWKIRLYVNYQQFGLGLFYNF
jgi:hypothetical protein